jgi:hypothetical protein
MAAPRLHFRCTWRVLAHLALLCGGLVTESAQSTERAKSDVVILQNGDRITGRILYAQYGILQVNSVQTGEVSIEWPNVRSVQSVYSFRVERLGGQYFAGVVSTDPEGKNLIVGSDANAVTIPLEEVYRVVPYESDFWQRINGSVSLGYNFTKSSDISQASFDFDSRYSDVALEAQLGAHFASTHASSDNNSAQAQITSSVYFLRPGPGDRRTRL